MGFKQDPITKTTFIMGQAQDKEKSVETTSPAKEIAIVGKLGTYTDQQSNEEVHWVLLKASKKRKIKGVIKPLNVTGFLKGSESFDDVFEVGDEVEMSDLKGLKFNL
jgi:hypothetical protein